MVKPSSFDVKIRLPIVLESLLYMKVLIIEFYGVTMEEFEDLISDWLRVLTSKVRVYHQP